MRWTPTTWRQWLNERAALAPEVRRAACEARGHTHRRGPEKFLTRIPLVICADCLETFPEDSDVWTDGVCVSQSRRLRFQARPDLPDGLK